jgi:hypothetical protein
MQPRMRAAALNIFKSSAVYEFKINMRRLEMEKKTFGLPAKILSALFIIGITTCVIVDFAVNGKLVWAGYPVVSILFAWVLTLPLVMAAKNKIAWTLLVLTVSLPPYLLAMDGLTPGAPWFAALGLPIAVCAVAVIWIDYVVLRFMKLNSWYKAAASVFLYGIVLSNAVNILAERFTSGLIIIFTLSNVINNVATIAVVVLLMIIGSGKIPKGGQKDKADSNYTPNA